MECWSIGELRDVLLLAILLAVPLDPRVLGISLLVELEHVVFAVSPEIDLHPLHQSDPLFQCYLKRTGNLCRRLNGLNRS